MVAEHIYITMKQNEFNMKHQLLAAHQSLVSLSPHAFSSLWVLKYKVGTFNLFDQAARDNSDMSGQLSRRESWRSSEQLISGVILSCVRAPAV